MTVIAQTTILAGQVGEVGPLYTRLLATDANGPHRGALFLTSEVYRPVDDGLPTFPIHRSDDGGSTWRLVSHVRDQHLRIGHRHQPTLYELPEPFAGLAKGTLLIAGNAIPEDMSSTHLVIYSSEDGVSWQYRGMVDEGGPAICDSSSGSTTTSVWEPDLRILDGVLLCFFADERRKPEGMHQVISMRSTRDFVSWSEPHLIKGVADGVSRPGMFVTTSRMPDGRFGAVMEIVGEPGVPVSWMTSADGVNWGPASDLGRRLSTSAGLSLTATPNVHWRQETNGAVTVIVTGRAALRDGEVVNSALINHNGGAGDWFELPLPTPAKRVLLHDDSGYSQTLLWNSQGHLVQATTVRNVRGSNDIVVTVAEAASLAA